MTEIWIPEIIICVFLLVFLLRPFFKNLWAVDGLAWLSVLGLVVTVGLFPAYGFRPECLPLLIFEIALTVLNIPLLAASASSRPSESFGEQGLVVPLIKIALCAAAMLTMFIFSPKIPLELISEGVQTRAIYDESRGNEYFMRIYGEKGGEHAAARPLIVLAPPEAGSVFAVDRICAALRDNGFTVISYSRRGLDSPAVGEGKKRFASAARLRALWQVFRKGTELQKANEKGRTLEAERRADIEFLLPLVLRNWDTDGRTIVLSAATAREWAEIPVFLAGYGAAGSALIYLSGSPGFTARYRNVTGIIAVESRLWSAYGREMPAESAAPENAAWFRRFAAGVAKRLRDLKPRKTAAPAGLPRPQVPALYLVSDRAVAGTEAAAPYRAILETMKNSSGPAVLAALEGAGPLDYCDFPLTHPLYARLFRGATAHAKPTVPIEDTAALIGNFARALLSRKASPAVTLPERRAVSATVLAESIGLPVF